MFHLASDRDEWFATKASDRRALLKAECKVAGLLTNLCREAEDRGHVPSHLASLTGVQGYYWLLRYLHALVSLRTCRGLTCIRLTGLSMMASL
jgi:hypothetical protein